MSIFSKGIKKIGSNSILNKFMAPDLNMPVGDAGGDQAVFDRMAAEEQAKRHDLGLQQQGQINAFSDDQASRASKYRQMLSKSLSDNALATFQRANPGILEDLNSRGLVTSQTARDQEQGRFLGDLARENNAQLSAFDTGQFDANNELRGSGLSALLQGDQSGLDAALGLRKSGLTRRFEVQDQNNQNAVAKQLAKRENYNRFMDGLTSMGTSFLSGGGMRGGGK